jgi:hypothetical protein
MESKGLLAISNDMGSLSDMIWYLIGPEKTKRENPLQVSNPAV